MIYLDSASTSIKPKEVVEQIGNWYLNHNASAGRGSYKLAAEASLMTEETRRDIMKFVNADDDYEVIFTSGATHGLNLTARVLEQNVSGDKNPSSNIVLSKAEHHSNILPWQQVSQRCNIELRYLNLNDDGSINLNDLRNVVDKNTKVISITHASNVTGKVTNLDQFNNILDDVIFDLKLGTENKPIVVLDVCQSIPHLQVELKKHQIDCAVFSAHKIYGPTGIGALIIKKELVSEIDPIFTGGGMVQFVEEEKSSYQNAPSLLEPGTPNMAGIFGLKAALKYTNTYGYDKIIEHETLLTSKIWNGFNSSKFQSMGVRTIGSYFDYKHNENITDQLPLCSFTVQNIHPHDLGQLLDSNGFALRTGHHCAQLVHRSFNVLASTRLSASIFNQESDIDEFFNALEDSIKFFRK